MSLAVKSPKVSEQRQAVADRVRALTSKSVYQAPKVVSFPINGMKASPTTFAGNTAF